MRVNFEYDMHLQYENKALKARIRELESGAAYVRMQEECEKRCREMEREVRKLKMDLKMLSASSVRTGNIGFRFMRTWKKNIKKLWKESRERSGDCRSFVKKLLLPMSRCMKNIWSSSA